MNLTEYLLLAIAISLGFFIQTLLGFAAPLIAMPILLFIFDIQSTVAFMSVFSLLFCIGLLFSNWKYIDKKILFELGLGIFLGTAVGVYLLKNDKDSEGKLSLSRSSNSLTNTDALVNINQQNSRKLVKQLNGRLLTTQLMYNLFIPYLKQEAPNGSQQASLTLGEMYNFGEWLEDQIINKNTLKIDNKKTKIDLPKSEGHFNKSDLNEFGYPKELREKNEYCYWHPVSNNIAALRDGDSRLTLNLCNDFDLKFSEVGLRLVKFLK